MSAALGNGNAAAKLNPITYALSATRSLVVSGWYASALGQGLLASLVLVAVTYLLAFLTLRSRTRRS